MSQENVECVARLYEALNRRDKEGLVREMHPDVEGVVYFMESEGRVYRGHQGAREGFDDIFSVFPDWHAEIQATEHGEAVLAEVGMRGTGAGSGVVVEQTGWQVLRFRDGKVVWYHGYGSRAEALEAMGLRE